MSDDPTPIIAAFPWPLYGLTPADDEERWVSKYGADTVVLAHGDGANRVDVGILQQRVAGEPATRTWRVDIRATLAHDLLLARHECSQARDPRQTSLAEAEPAGPEAWSPMEVWVDGKPERFEMLSADQQWVAFVERDGWWLFVHSWGRSPGGVALTRVTDADPYILGTDVEELDDPES